MHPKTRHKILNVAQDARAFIKHFAKDNPDIGCPETLRCYCAIAAAHLCTALKKNGIKAEVAVNDLHAFVLVGEHVKHIVDITATQFGENYPEVVLMPLSAKFKNERFWNPRKVFTNMVQLGKHQAKERWAEEQHVVLEIC